MRPHPLCSALSAAFPLRSLPVALTAAALIAPYASAAETAPAAESDAPVKSLGVVTINGRQPSSLPTQIPTTMETVTRRQIEETVNAVDSEDALKYFPSLLVRKRYNDDYNHAILSTRASGTGNSARSMVYADGILLSNLLGNGVGGLSYPPRWNMVTPEEIDRVTVMYGPFSAAYAGNSAGAVVDYVTRMPTKFEGHVAVGFVDQPFELYSTSANYKSWQTSASLGSKSGDLSWWFNVSHTDSEGQPLTFATRLLSAGSATCPTGTTCTPVTGAVQGNNSANAPWYILGTATQYHTKQDHLRVKLAYDFTSAVRATYTLGLWQNTSEGRPESYLRNASGQTVYSGPISINGLNYAGSQALTGGDFPLTNQSSTHYMHGLSVKSRTRGEWDWEVVGSLYDYAHDQMRQNAAGNPLPNAAGGGAGTIADGNGSGWNTLGFKGTWRPDGMDGPHILDFGLQQDSYKLNYQTSNITGNWQDDGAGALVSNIEGQTRLRSLWAQDTWAFAPRWKTVLGARFEHWRAYNGLTNFSASSAKSYEDRSENHLSPKAAVSYQFSDDTVLKASLGRAIRFPTVAELYGATSTTNSQYINDPNLKPEASWTSEWTAEKDLGGDSTVRGTFFFEDVRNSLYSQTVYDTSANKNISRVQNVGRIKTSGLEVAWRGRHVWLPGLDLSASGTYAKSVIKDNEGFVAVAGDTLGMYQPNIPKWRATAVATYHFNDAFSVTYAARYSGPQYRTLNNADVNGYAYMGVSRYFTTDLRALWHIDRTFTASVGIDNLNNYQYWNFHPYPQRSYSARLQADF